jgi:hypothetical protein
MLAPRICHGHGGSLSDAMPPLHSALSLGGGLAACWATSPSIASGVWTGSRRVSACNSRHVSGVLQQTPPRMIEGVSGSPVRWLYLEHSM